VESKGLFLIMDIGTTSVKVSILDSAFKAVSHDRMEYLLITDGATVEMQPAVYWQALEQSATRVLSTCDRQKITGITVTTQGETMIPVDNNGVPVGNAVVWLDNRAEKQAREIRGIISEEEFYQNTGVPECNGLCPVSKLLWFKQNRPEEYERTKYFLLLEDYIIYLLTGRFITEKSLLSTTGYFNLNTDGIWTELLDKLGLDARKIPPAAACGQNIGEILPAISRAWQLSPDVKIISGAMDQVCSAIGAGNILSGKVTETTGTSLCLGATRIKQEICTKYRLPVYRHYTSELQLLLPVCMTAGMAVKWFKDTFCEQEIILAGSTGASVYDLLDELAKESPPLANGVIMLPYLSGSLQPYHSPQVRASFHGIGLNTTRGDFMRSILEGIGYMLKENIILLEKTCGIRIENIISMGGGAKSSLLLEIKSNIANLSFEADAQSETTSQGAAMLCAVGLGVYGNLEAALSVVEREVTVFHPEKETAELYKAGFERYAELLKHACETAV